MIALFELILTFSSDCCVTYLFAKSDMSMGEVDTFIGQPVVFLNVCNKKTIVISDAQH